MTKAELIKFAHEAPAAPGVYFFRDQNDEILYIGKAIHIGNRLKQYQNPQDRGPALVLMVEQAVAITWLESESEIEAILKEAQLIRTHKPKYNSLGKDDKSAAYIRVNWSERYPRIWTIREREIEKGFDSVGPKKKKDAVFGPFVSLGLPPILRTMRRLWQYRDCSPHKFASYRRLGRGCLYHQLNLCQAPCIAAVNEQEYNQTIKQLTNFVEGKKSLVLQEMEEQMRQLSDEGEYEKAAVIRDRWLRLLDLRSFAGRGILRSFEDVVTLDEPTGTVEAYDISNIMGELAVGVAVRATVPLRASLRGSDIVLAKDAYKKFRIKSVVGANDPAMLAEVLTRRFRRAKTGGAAWALPDLIIVDGGATQLAAARQAAKSSGVIIPIMAVAKGKTRKKVDLLFRVQDARKIPFDESARRQIALTLREEAHRFAIAYYRLLHRKQLRSS